VKRGLRAAAVDSAHKRVIPSRESWDVMEQGTPHIWKEGLRTRNKNETHTCPKDTADDASVIAPPTLFAPLIVFCSDQSEDALSMICIAFGSDQSEALFSWICAT